MIFVKQIVSQYSESASNVFYLFAFKNAYFDQTIFKVFWEPFFYYISNDQ